MYVYMCVRACMRVYNTCIYTYLYICICMYIYTLFIHAQVHTPTNACTLYSCSNVLTHTCIFIYTYMYIYICVFMYLCSHLH